MQEITLQCYFFLPLRELRDAKEREAPHDGSKANYYLCVASCF